MHMWGYITHDSTRTHNINLQMNTFNKIIIASKSIIKTYVTEIIIRIRSKFFLQKFTLDKKNAVNFVRKQNIHNASI